MAKGGSGGGEATMRYSMHLFLEGKTPMGLYFTLATVGLIILNIVGFIMSTVQGFEPYFYESIEQLEDVSVMFFTVEYLLRFWSSADDAEHKMIRSNTRKLDINMTRLSWCTSFYAIVDICSIAPYYFEMFSLQFTKAACKGEGVIIELPAFQFVRIFRLLRVMRLDGKYLEACTVFDDIYREQKELLFKSGFVGAAVWVILSGANWWAERHNPAMEGKMDSIGQASFYTLCNLFGEFPLVNERGPAGKVIAVFTAAIACAVFGIFCGIFGGAFQDHTSKKKEERAKQAAQAGDDGLKDANKESEPILVDGQMQSFVYKVVHGINSLGWLYENLMLLLIVANCGGFVYGSQAHVAANKDVSKILDALEDVSVLSLSLSSSRSLSLALYLHTIYKYTLYVRTSSHTGARIHGGLGAASMHHIHTHCFKCTYNIYIHTVRTYTLSHTGACIHGGHVRARGKCINNICTLYVYIHSVSTHTLSHTGACIHGELCASKRKIYTYYSCIHVISTRTFSHTGACIHGGLCAAAIRSWLP